MKRNFLEFANSLVDLLQVGRSTNQYIFRSLINHFNFRSLSTQNTHFLQYKEIKKNLKLN